jgi:hypothetical protein
MSIGVPVLNLDTVQNFEDLKGASKVFPLPMPVFVNQSDPDIYLVYSVMGRDEWMKDASMNPKIDISSKTAIPLELPSEIFNKHFLPLGGEFEGTGIYGKTPNSVTSLRIEVPCSYNSATKRHLVSPDSIIVKTQNGIIRHFSENEFEKKFIDNLSLLSSMKIEMKNHELKQPDAELSGYGS